MTLQIGGGATNYVVGGPANNQFAAVTDPPFTFTNNTGATALFAFDAMVDTGGPPPRGTFDLNVSCLSSSADLSITKTDNVATYTPGGQTTYTIVATNNGPSNVTGATVIDPFPAAITAASWTCTASAGSSCTANGMGNISDSVNLLSGGTATYTVVANIDAAATGNLVNTATVVVPQGVTDPTPGNNSATDFDTPRPQADLSITKTDNAMTYTPGGQTTYTIVATNNGPSNVTGATVTDSFPAAITAATWTCTASAGSSCTANGMGNISDSVNLLSGGTATYTVIANIDAAATGNLVNTATVATPGVVIDPTPGNNSATDTDTLDAQADLSITKTDNAMTYTPGGQTTYTIVATNNGPSNVTGATVTDPFPAAITAASWTCTASAGSSCTANGMGNISDSVNLLSGGTATYTVIANIDAAATGNLVNTATVATPQGVTDPTPGNNSATDTDTPDAQADLSITKTDGVATYTPGGQTTYTIVATNNGPSNVTGATVTDPFPAAITAASWTCTASAGSSCTANGMGNISDSVNLLSGGTATYTVIANIDAAATGNLVNTATVATPQGVTDPTPGNNSATDTDTLDAQADLSITKTDGVATYTPGGQTTYTIVATNNGPSNVTGATVTDPFPAAITAASWTCTASAGSSCTANGMGNISDSVNLLSGGTATYTVVANIDAAATGNLVNTATVATPQGVTDPTPGNNSATDTDTPDAQADLSITKTDNAMTYTPGGQTTYTIVATNNGPSNVTGATVTDPFPAAITAASWTCTASAGSSCTANGMGNISDSVNLLSGGTATYTVVADIDVAATGDLVNTATVATPQGVTDPTPGNNSATDTDTLSARADLSITKTDGVATYTPGGQTTYTIVATNNGPSNVTGATVTDTFPAAITAATWTCTASAGSSCTANGMGNISDSAVNLVSGGTATYTVVADIDAAATGDLINTATVATPQGVTDSNAGNNSATDTDTATPQSDLSITKNDGVTSVDQGGTTTYTIVASNSGPSDVTGVTVTDMFPSAITSASWTCVGAGGGICGSAAGNGSINELVDLPAGATVTYTVVANISNTATGNLVNTATVTVPNGVTDPTPGNNSSTDTDQIIKKADDQMDEVTQLFVHRRVDNLLTHGPDRARLLRRVQNSTQGSNGQSNASEASSNQLAPVPQGFMGLGSSVQQQTDVQTSIRNGEVTQTYGNALGRGDQGSDYYGLGQTAPAASNSIFSQIASNLTTIAGGTSNFKFSTSLSELRQAAVDSEQKRQAELLKEAGLGYANAAFANRAQEMRQGWDIWAEGHISKYNEGLGGYSRDGDFRILYVGADYPLAPGVLIGALVQVDDTNEDVKNAGLIGEVSGTGWMAGPYLGIKLAENLFFDTRFAYGTSSNDIWLNDAVTGYRTGSFDTDRWLATATLTGSEYFGNFRISPQFGFAYGAEWYGNYFSSIGQFVKGHDISIGRINATLEVGYRFELVDGTTVEPEVSISGLINFSGDDLVIGGQVLDPNDNRAKLEGGVIIRTPSGYAIRAAASYDGIGQEDFEAYSGSLWINVPLN